MNDMTKKLKDLQFALLETNVAVGVIRKTLEEGGTAADIQPALANIAHALDEAESGLRPLLSPNENNPGGIPIQHITHVCTWLRSYAGTGLGNLGAELSQELLDFIDSVDAGVQRGAVKP